MYYYVTEYKPQEHEVSWQDMLFNFEAKDLFGHKKNTTNQTFTNEYVTMPVKLENRDETYAHIAWLFDFNRRHEDLFLADRRSLYRSYKIPKHSGGLRQIDEPLEPLMDALKELRDELMSWGLFHHTAAYAYITKRCTIDALRIHQRFGSEYYLKTDLSNFFGSTTEQFIFQQFKKIVPFCFICRDIVYNIDGIEMSGFTELAKALSLAFLDGGLPQGTPISPFLTNLVMIPVDFELAHLFSNEKLVYTRYADDMLISGRENFPWKKAVEQINEAFEHQKAPYHINEKKTRYGSIRGSNFNLGLCTNADNNITVGYKNKKIFKAMVNNFIMDTKNGIKWSIGDVQHMNGLLSYYTMVEPDYFNDMITRYNTKYLVDFRQMVKKYLAGLM